MQDLQRISKGVFFKTISSILVVLFGLAISVFLNRHYGKETYGLLVLVYTVTSFCCFFSDLGAKQTINRFLPKYLKSKAKKEAYNLLGSGILFQCLGILIFAAILFLLSDLIASSFFHRQELMPLIKIGILFFISYSILDFVFQVLQALQIWWKESILNVLYLMFYLTLICVFALTFHASLKWVLVSNSIAAFGIAILGLYLFPKEVKSSILKKLSFSRIRNSSKTIINFGLPLLANNFNFFIMMGLAKILLGKYRPITEVTFYHIAFIFYTGIMLLFKTLYTVFMPYLASISNEPKEQIHKIFILVFRWFFQWSILISIVAFSIIEPIVKFLYGADYLPVVSVFRMLTLLIILRGITNPLTIFIVNVFGMAKQSIILGSLLAGTTVILGILLIPTYGYQGAIIASVVGYSFWIGGSLLIQKIRKMMPLASSLKTAASLIILIIIYFMLGFLEIHNPFILTIFLPILYLILLKIFGEIKHQDIEVFKQIIMSFKKHPQTVPLYELQE